MLKLLQCSVFCVVAVGSTAVAHASPINLLSNPGFETGSFLGWTVGGNSTQVGVATDGTAIPNAPFFFPDLQNVRSGSFGGNALVRSDSVETVILSQTLAVLPGQNVDVGFWVGNDSIRGFGLSIGDGFTQVFVNGIGLLGGISPVINPGSGPGDFQLINGTFNTGANTSITVDYAINGSGTARVGLSFDDFFFITEDPAAASAPEPATLALLGVGLAGIGVRRRSQHSAALK